jgi:hypothetical protein
MPQQDKATSPESTEDRLYDVVLRDLRIKYAIAVHTLENVSI